MNSPVPCYISLGSNLGTPEKQLAKALKALCAPSFLQGQIHCDKVSPVYFTQPQEMNRQPWFANQVIRVLCKRTLFPTDMLHALLDLETALGRIRQPGRKAGQGSRFGPRIIDLDILLFGTCNYQTKHLCIPHPRLSQRAFVLVPLADIAPDLVLPEGLPLTWALQKLEYTCKEGRIWQEVKTTVQKKV